MQKKETKIIEIGWWIFKKKLIIKDGKVKATYSKKDNVYFVDFGKREVKNEVQK